MINQKNTFVSLAEQLALLNKNSVEVMTKLNDVRKWAIVARKHDWHYIIKVTPKNGDDLAVYCKDFDELHKMWHQLNDSSFLKPVDIIRVNHDGTYEEGLEIHNLL